jgi:cholesterol oxidase
MKISRRNFVSAVGAGAAALGVTRGAKAAVPLKREDHRVVVIGSGFGGGVSALRLAQAGVPVTVLERGKWWKVGPGIETFPNSSGADKRLLWYEANPTLFGQPLLFEKYAGLLDTMINGNLTPLCAAGVGGGSLVYQGMTLQPAENVFNAWLPPELDWAKMNEVHYPRVAKMLRATTAPDELIASPTYKAARVFAERCRAAGFQVEKIPMPIDWDYALGELSGKNPPLLTAGLGVFGVNYGAKFSVDRTYIQAAIETGNCTVNALHNVTSIARAKDGRWQVFVNHTDESGNILEQKVITTKALILAAGCLGTNKLLVRAKARWAIPNLPDAVGQGYGSDADRIYAWSDPAQQFGITQGGPVVYVSKDWSDASKANTVIQAAFPGVGGGIDLGATMLVGYGVSKDRGSFTYNWLTDKVELNYPRNPDQDAFNNVNPRVTAITKGEGLLLDSNAFFNTTWHSVGGANMGSVCDLEGRVMGQKGLYVLDGALMPGNTAACNPSMTIAAVAERAMDIITQKDIGTLI